MTASSERKIKRHLIMKKNEFLLDNWSQIVLIYSIGLFLLLFISFIIISLRVSYKEKVVVPALVGTLYFDHHNPLVSKNLKIYMKTTNLFEYPEGYIISQSVPPGEVVREGTKLTLLVNQSKATLHAPKLVDKLESLVPSILNSVHAHNRVFKLKKGVVTYVPSARPKGIILAQYPLAGASITPDIPISYLVSLGKELTLFQPPQVIGKNVHIIKRMAYFIRTPLKIISKKVNSQKEAGFILKSKFENVAPEMTWQTIQDKVYWRIMVGRYDGTSDHDTSKIYPFSSTWVNAVDMRLPSNAIVTIGRRIDIPAKPGEKQDEFFYEPEAYLLLDKTYTDIPLFVDTHSHFGVWKSWQLLNTLDTEKKIGEPLLHFTLQSIEL